MTERDEEEADEDEDEDEEDPIFLIGHRSSSSIGQSSSSLCPLLHRLSIFIFNRLYGPEEEQVFVTLLIFIFARPFGDD